jgi:hypothetical protein
MQCHPHFATIKRRAGHTKGFAGTLGPIEFARSWGGRSDLLFDLLDSKGRDSLTLSRNSSFKW